MPRQKWKKSLDHIQNQKSKWKQYSTDKQCILEHLRSMPLDKLQEKYTNMPDYFWRDSGKNILLLIINHFECLLVHQESQASAVREAGASPSYLGTER